eukprot:4185815-Prymnesium_polylepis.1
MRFWVFKQNQPTQTHPASFSTSSHRQRRARGSTDQHGQAWTGTHKPHKPHETDKRPGVSAASH